jgi:hypothetical protein
LMKFDEDLNRRGGLTLCYAQSRLGSVTCGKTALGRGGGCKDSYFKRAAMDDYLLHIYRKGSEPFQTLSDLPEENALQMMEHLYMEGAVFWERFKEPQNYLSFRKKVELTMRTAFKNQGGKPINEHPIYLVLGRPKWMDTVSDEKTLQTTQTIRIPLSLIKQDIVSFTYPDSMVSALMAAEQNPEYYEPEYHGKVFTLNEIMEIIKEKGLPGDGWETRMPKHYAHYIEAQIWDRKVLADYLRQNRPNREKAT